MSNKLRVRFVFFVIAAISFSNILYAQKKVLIIGIDGCRPDALLKANTPNLDNLWKNGAYSFYAKTDKISSSGICWTGMLTGVWHEKHNVISNDYKNPNVEEYPHFFRRIKEQKPELKTFSVVNWNPIHKILQEGDADITNYLLTDDKVAKRVADLLSNDNPDVMFVQLDEVDHAGHEYDFNPRSTKYLKAIEKSDKQVETILKALYERENYEKENWLVIVSTDHGGSNFGHGKDIPEHTTIFYIASGKDVNKGEIEQQVNVIDVAVTALKYLDISIKKEWNLDGETAGI